MDATVDPVAPRAERVSDAYRWTQLAIGVGCMVMIANYQYGWTFFVPDIQKTFGWDRAAISGVAALSLLSFGVAQPIVGRLIDRHGPRGVLTG